MAAPVGGVMLFNSPHRETSMPTFDEVHQFECDVFKPETASLSEKEIKVMLKQLYKYFPYTEHNEKCKPYDTDSEYSKKWFQSYNHLLMLLEMKKQEAKHNISMWLSVIAIIVSIGGVIVRSGATA